MVRRAIVMIRKSALEEARNFFVTDLYFMISHTTTAAIIPMQLNVIIVTRLVGWLMMRCSRTRKRS